MRCKHCDHSLWNQPVPPEGQPRLCSECGTPYTAAEFDYGRGKVRFCCPGCQKGYYGTSQRGHLEPAEFDCIGCGAHLSMERCIIRAHDMERENEAMQHGDLPWIDEGSLGWIRRWWRTVRLADSGAALAVALRRRPPKVLSAAAFVLTNALITTTIVSAFSGLLPTLFVAKVPAGLDLVALGIALVGILASSVALVAFCAIPAICCCWITRKGEPLGLARGYEISAYSTGALLLSLIPCCGILIGPLVWAIRTIGAFVAYFTDEPIGTRVIAGICAAAGFAAVLVVSALFFFFSV